MVYNDDIDKKVLDMFNKLNDIEKLEIIKDGLDYINEYYSYSEIKKLYSENILNIILYYY